MGKIDTVLKKALGAMTLTFLAPIIADAAIFWEDGFEPDNTGYQIVAGMSYSSSIIHTGSRSLKQHFLGNHVQGGTFTDRSFPFPTEDLWSRYYLYLDNFVPDAIQTKMMYQGDSDRSPSFWWGMLWGYPTLSVQVQGINGGRDTLNIYGPTIPQNRWVCIETHIKLNSPGVSNGMIEAWIDGVQGLARYDVPMRDARLNGHNDPTTKFKFNRLYVQYGGGDLFYDTLAFGDERIGCTGNVSKNDSTPPSSPTDLNAR